MTIKPLLCSALLCFTLISYLAECLEGLLGYEEIKGHESILHLLLGCGTNGRAVTSPYDEFLQVLFDLRNALRSRTLDV